MKFRKKPVVIEAVEVSEVLRAASKEWDALPDWVAQAYEGGSLLLLPHWLEILTLEGTMRAELSDWLIQGVKGELYPCKPDIFEATYEKVEP